MKVISENCMQKFISNLSRIILCCTSVLL